MGGFRIATIRGIPIRIHVTFLLVLPLLALAFARAFREAAELADVPSDRLAGEPWLWGLGVALALFASVLVHELAHSLYAQRKGGHIRDITLFMVGGVAQMAEPPREPRHEAIMAAVGPLASLALGGLFYALHLAIPAEAFSLRFALFYLGGLNVVLAIFNLLPAFPMDGGRILRALLVRRLGIVRATSIASVIGRTFAVLFGVLGFLTFNMLLLIIAFFVYMGSEAETRTVIVQALLGRLRVRDLMSRHVASIAADISVHEAAERMLHERRLVFAATENGHAVGLITLDAIQAVPSEERGRTPVRSIAVTTPPLSPDEEAGKALRLMGESAAQQLAVADDGHVVGIISREDIVRGLKLSELETSQHKPSTWSMRRMKSTAT